MAKKPEKNLLVSLDIGTSKVAVIVAEVTDKNTLEVIGYGVHPSRGLKRGIIVNIESTALAIQNAVEQAELMTGCEIHSVYTSISGSHIRGMNSHGIVAVHQTEVSAQDVDRVIDAARAVAFPADQKILHILPQEYAIDNESVREPIGMSGVRLEAQAHIVTASVSAIQNVAKCIQRCGLVVDDIILEPLAASQAVLTEDEKELGVCVINIGGGTTDIVVFLNGAIRHTAVIPIAGDQVTNDLVVALRTPINCAEEIKIQHACALTNLANIEETIEVPTVGERPPRRLSRRLLAEVIEPRYEELFSLVQAELRRSGYEDSLASGIVLTGGSAKATGVVELAEEIFHIPVRLGYPMQNVGGLPEIIENPAFATGVGLLAYGHLQQMSLQLSGEGKSSFKNLWHKMKSWFQGSF